MVVSIIASLPSLKKMASLPDIGETPVSDRFTDALLKQWNYLLNSLSRMYCIPDHISADDLKQELIQQIWRLTSRIDPITKPEDFARMCRTELRYKCIDINRHAKARKRMGRSGRAVQCLCCGSVTRLALKDDLVCGFCGEYQMVKAVETYARNVSISSDYDDDDSIDNFVSDSSVVDPVDSIILDELHVMVQKAIDAEDMDVYNLFVNPSESYLSYLHANGHESDHKNVSNRLVAGFLRRTERDVSDSQTRIKLAIKHICYDTTLNIGELNKVTLKRLGL